MSDKPTCTVNVSRQFNMSANTIFDAWLDPKKAGKFLFVTPTGVMKKVEIDARVGGQFCIVESRNGEDAIHIGEYLEIIRPSRLRFSFGGNPFPATYVTISIRSSQTGCELNLIHDGVWMEYRESVTQGWSGILDHLAQLDIG
ncbi:SRPBCC family protein [Undibacterium fentianense]|uniref:SRPBCC domain-containing protein n=1 Tax=Undibacterium fentianense TaxID=2828728 RepID=A0A941E2D1_9BURK|nr:SRPBCC domain-containing protein [Undibacterium fentianense]MBR7799957.1 SRPBCC domain-containing protein [Undibacterium fentianense]